VRRWTGTVVKRTPELMPLVGAEGTGAAEAECEEDWTGGREEDIRPVEETALRSELDVCWLVVSAEVVVITVAVRRPPPPPPSPVVVAAPVMRIVGLMKPEVDVA
jgi:hypothetical protein